MEKNRKLKLKSKDESDWSYIIKYILLTVKIRLHFTIFGTAIMILAWDILYHCL